MEANHDLAESFPETPREVECLRLQQPSRGNEAFRDCKKQRDAKIQCPSIFISCEKTHTFA